MNRTEGIYRLGFFASQAVSLLIGFPPLLISFAIPFLGLDIAFLLPFILLLPLLEGGYTLSFILPTETLTLLVLLPIILFQIFRNAPSADKGVNYFYAYYGSIVVLGAINAIARADIAIDLLKIVKNNVINLAQLFFFYLVYLFFLSLNISGLRKGLYVLKSLGAPVLILIFLYMVFKGERYGFQQYLNYGVTRHGTFTATLVSVSAFAWYTFLAKSVSMRRKVLSALSLLLTIWVIVNSQSRNGMLSFVLIAVLSYSLFGSHKLNRWKLLFLSFIGISAITFFIVYHEHPALQEFRDQFAQEESLKDISSGRTSLWMAGLKGFLESPIIGQGGDPLLSRAFAEQNVGINNVIHNTIIELMIQYGLLGMVAYLFLQAFIIKGYRDVAMSIEDISQNDDGVFLVPFVAYASLLFSSLFVSWLWSSMIWYHVSLLLAIITLHRRS